MFKNQNSYYIGLVSLYTLSKHNLSHTPGFVSTKILHGDPITSHTPWSQPFDWIKFPQKRYRKKGRFGCPKIGDLVYDVPKSHVQNLKASHYIIENSHPIVYIKQNNFSNKQTLDSTRCSQKIVIHVAFEDFKINCFQF